MQVAGLHGGHHGVQARHGPAHVAADDEAARQAEKHHQRARSRQGVHDLLHIGFGLADVGADEQVLAPRKARLLAARGLAHLGAGGVGLGDAELGPGHVVVGGFDRRLGDGAADPPAVLVHQQVEEGPPVDHALDHRLVQGVDTALAVDRFQRMGLGGDVAVGAAGHLPRGHRIDVEKEGEVGQGEDRQEHQRQAERRGAEQRRQSHLISRP